MLPAAWWVGRSWIEIALLAGSVMGVLIVELLNSAIETVVDRVSSELHPLSKRAKDIGSAAVMLSLDHLCGAVVRGVVAALDVGTRASPFRVSASIAGRGRGPTRRSCAARTDGRCDRPQRGWQLVYGGGRVGLMGALADAALAAGAEVARCHPAVADAARGRPRTACTRLQVVDTMHERKRLMAEHCNAFIALPGGIGTFEELFEVWSWRHLGYHERPIGLLDVAGYFQPAAVDGAPGRARRLRHARATRHGGAARVTRATCSTRSRHWRARGASPTICAASDAAARARAG